jgi:hypothetical protein
VYLVRTKLLQRCSYPNCSTLTMGMLCMEHDVPVLREFVRGRPWVPDPLGATATVLRPVEAAAPVRSAVARGA